MKTIKDNSIYRDLAKHDGHIGVYIFLKDGIVELRCFARFHGGKDIVLLRVKKQKEIHNKKLKRQCESEGQQTNVG